jgi:hypothetical protein
MTETALEVFNATVFKLIIMGQATYVALIGKT